MTPRLLRRLLWAEIIVVFVAAFFALLVSDADAQTAGTGYSPWDRPGEPTLAPAARVEASAASAEDEPKGECTVLLGLPAYLACKAVRAGTDAAEGIVGGIAATALDRLVQVVVEAAVWFLAKIASFLDASTNPDLTSGWFTGQYTTMTGLAGLIVLPLLLLAIVDAVVHARPGQILRSLFVYLPVAGIVTAVGVELVHRSLQVTDWASAYVSGGLAADTAGFLEAVGSVFASTGVPGLPVGVMLVGGLFTVFGALLLWIELVLRNAGINLAVLFLPLAFATMVWPRISRWSGRALRTLAALILSKFFVVAVISFGASMLATVAGPGAVGDGMVSVNARMVGPTVVDEQAGLEVVIAGVALLAMATFAPWVLWRMLSPVEGAMDAALEGVVRRPTAAARPPRMGQVTAMGAKFAGSHAKVSLPVAGAPAGRSAAPPAPMESAPAAAAGAAGGATFGVTAAVRKAGQATDAVRRRAVSETGAFSTSAGAPSALAAVSEAGASTAAETGPAPRSGLERAGDQPSERPAAPPTKTLAPSERASPPPQNRSPGEPAASTVPAESSSPSTAAHPAPPTTPRSAAGGRPHGLAPADAEPNATEGG